MDLLFEISEREIHTYIGGTVLKAKQWPMEAGSRYFGVRFFPGQCILPEDLSIKELINADIEIDGNYLGNRLTDRIQEGHTLEDWARIFLTYYGEKALKKQEDKGWNRLEEYVRNRIYESGGSVDMSTLEKKPDTAPAISEEVLSGSTVFLRKPLKNLFDFRILCIM